MSLGWFKIAGTKEYDVNVLIQFMGFKTKKESFIGKIVQSQFSWGILKHQASPT